MNKYNGILQALKAGNHLACWASGGGVRIAAIIHEQTIGSGEGGDILEALENANSDWLRFLQKKEDKGTRDKERISYMTGGDALCGEDTAGKLDRWIKKGCYMRIDYDTHSDIYLVMLDGMIDCENVILQGADKDFWVAVEKAFEASKCLA